MHIDLSSLSLSRALVLALLSLFSASGVLAQSVWNGGGADALWSNGDNWGGAAPVSPKELHFTGVTNLAPQNDLTGFTATRIEFLSGAGAFSITGNAIGLSGNIVNSSPNAQSLALNMALTAGTHVFQAGGVMTLSGNLSESGGMATISKTGTGTLILSGDNSFTGAVNIAASGGVVRVTSNTAFGTSAGGVTVGAGSRVELQGATITGESLSIAGDGGDGQGAIKAVGGGTSSWTGNIGISSATGNFGNRIGTNGASTLALSGDISGTGDLAIRTDGNAAGIIQLSGSTKTYTGATFLVIGELRLGAANMLPAGTVLSVGNTSNTNFATLNLNGNNQEVAGLISLGTTMSMKITSATAATLTVNNSAVQAFTGLIDTAVALTKNGTGTLALGGTAANTYTGATTINTGVLRLDSSNRIGDTSIVTLNGTGTLRLNGNNDTVAGLVSASSTSIVENEGAGTGTLTVTINNTTATTATSVALQTFAGILRDGDGTGTDGTLALTVAKSGSGAGTSVLELTNANTYSGVTTVSNANAAIRVSHANALGAGGSAANGTVVNSGGRVEVSGGVTVANEFITITGNGTAPNSAGALRSTGTGTAVWAGRVSLGAATGGDPSTTAARIGADGAALEISGVISDEGLNRDLAIRNNSGKVVISGTSNSYRNTYIVIGELEMGAVNALPTSTIVSIGNNSNTGSQKWDLNGLNQTVRGIVDLGVTGATNLISNDASATNAVLTVSTQSGDDHQFGFLNTTSSATIGGNVSLVKTGEGVQRIGSNNAYTGSTTVTGGILQVGGAGTAAARDNGDTGNNVVGNVLTVNTAGTVVGTGNIAGTSAVTHLVGTGGTIAPGDVLSIASADPTAVGTLGVTGNLNATGGTIRLQISGSTSAAVLPLYYDPGYAAAAMTLTTTTESAATGTARGNHDLLTLSGQLTLSDTSTVSVTWHDLATSGYVPAAGDSFDLVDWTGTALSGTFNVGTNFRSSGTGGGNLELPELADALFWDVSKFLSNGVLIIATPEPGRALLFMIGLGALVTRRRRSAR